MSYRPKLLGLCAALLVAGCATQPVPPATATETATEASAYPTSCVRETGTRIRLPPGACVSLPGRAYTRDDIDYTGALSLGEALFRLGAF